MLEKGGGGAAAAGAAAASGVVGGPGPGAGGADSGRRHYCGVEGVGGFFQAGPLAAGGHLLEFLFNGLPGDSQAGFHLLRVKVHDGGNGCKLRGAVFCSGCNLNVIIPCCGHLHGEKVLRAAGIAFNLGAV